MITRRNPDPKIAFPTTVAEARYVARKVFRENRWDERDVRSYLADLGLEKLLDDLDRDELQIVIAALEKSRMVLFQEH